MVQNPSHPSILNSSAIAYLEKAVKELSEGKSFATEEAFKAWLSENLDRSISRASEINRSIFKKLEIDNGQKAISLLAAKVHEEINIRNIRAKARANFSHITNS